MNKKTPIESSRGERAKGCRGEISPAPSLPFSPAPFAPAPSHPFSPAALSLPLTLEYRPLTSGERWRVERFEALVVEFGLNVAAVARRCSTEPEHHALASAATWVELMGEFHEVVCAHARWWLFVRRLFGVMPLAPGANAHPDEMRAWSRQELCETFGISTDDLKEELEAVRGLWGNHSRGERERGSGGDSPPAPFPPCTLSPLPPFSPAPLPLLVEENLLEEFGFAESMFVLAWKETAGDSPGRSALAQPGTVVDKKRPDEENRKEKAWFCRRLADWARMLREPMAEPIARGCLLDELELKRIEADMFQHKSGTPSHTALQKSRTQLRENYSRGLEQITEMFPEMGVAGKVAFKAVTSDWVMGYVKAIASGDFKLLDRVHTASEMAVDLRQSVQAPLPKYRLGQTLYIIEAMNGLFDPNWRSELKPSFLRKMDTGFAEAVDRVRREGNEPLVDLMKEGPGGEYGDEMEAIG